MNKISKKEKRTVVVPTSLIARLEALGLSKTHLNQCYHIIYLITMNPSSMRSLLTDWIPLSYSFITKVVSQRSPQLLNILGEAGIIDCDDRFHENKALLYRMNSSVDYSEQCEPVVFSFSRTYQTKEAKINSEEIIKFSCYLKTLDINFTKLEGITANHVNNLSIDKFTTNYDIEWEEPKKVEIIDALGNFHATYFNKQQAMTFAANQELDIIQDGNEIKIMDAEQFIESKKVYVRAYYTNCLEALKHEATIYAKRNTTNSRLDTNFTSMPSILLDEIYLDNDILEIDAVNSQPSLLAYQMEQEGVVGDDVEVFLEISFNGFFYEYMANKLGVTRKRAKSITFEVLFSSSIANSESKKAFRKAFPTVWEYIKAYKATNGSNAFAVRLQSLESSIFINQIFNPLTKKGIRLLTKHDSVACKSEDFIEVLTFMNEVYAKLDFKGTLKTK